MEIDLRYISWKESRTKNVPDIGFEMNKPELWKNMVSRFPFCDKWLEELITIHSVKISIHLQNIVSNSQSQRETSFNIV